MNRVLRWLDRYLYVDRLSLGRANILPVMNGVQWAGYVAVAVGLGLVLPWLADTVDGWVRGLPGGGLLSLLVVPFELLVCGLAYAVLLPAKRARADLPGEFWLFGGLVAVGTLLSILFRHGLRAG